MEQVPASDGSAYQEYALTQKGRELLPVLVALRQWGESYLFSRGEKRLQVLDKRTRKPPRLEVQNAKGEILTADDLELVTVKIERTLTASNLLLVPARNRPPREQRFPGSEHMFEPHRAQDRLESARITYGKSNGSVQLRYNGRARFREMVNHKQVARMMRTGQLIRDSEP